MTKASWVRAVVTAGLVCASTFAGCRCAPDGPSTSPSASAPAAVAPPPAESREDVDIKPVYPQLDGPPDPRAARLCEALHDLPAKRRGACCGEGPGMSFAAECRRNVSGALKLGGIVIAEADLDKCVAALEQSHQGCDWVASGGRLSGAPTECADVLKGQLAKGARCRSSLECTTGLRCHGVGPTTTGVCGPPRERALCGASVDVLATYTRDDSYDTRHPECAGACVQRRCATPLASGADCQINRECDKGLVCEAGKCVKGQPGAEGEKCAGGECRAGLRCVGGTCKPPAKEGAACTSDAECRAECVKPAGATEGTCTKECAMLRGPMPGLSLGRTRIVRPPPLPKKSP